MNSFLRYFFASLLALVVFCIIGFAMLVGAAGSAVAKQPVVVSSNSVLEIDLNNTYPEQPQKNISAIFNDGIAEQMAFYDVLQLIDKARADNNIKGILLKANGNPNGMATSDEIRAALASFKKSGKFIMATADVLTQKAYAIANVADKIYITPTGGMEWKGFAVNLTFLKNLLDKLEIKPQIFYAGKFKSATEPLRFEKMSEPNKVQTIAWLQDLYSDFLIQTSEARHVDTATLHQLANTGAIQTAQDAVAHHLIDAVKYDDEVKDELRAMLKLNKGADIPFINIEKYADAVMANRNDDNGNIALIYATGNIVDGKGNVQEIGSETYIKLLRQARLDKAVKAIVVRVNSGGGSALASENIWREMYLAKKDKPLYVSFGDVAASGGYYMSCIADSIFATHKTITGSIGVFSIIPDLTDFFKDKAGITFDGVKTGPLADAGSITHPMTAQEQQLVQQNIQVTYNQFKQRVAEGRRRDTAYIEQIAQGRVWSGLQAKNVGLVDTYGGLQQALQAAAAKAGIKEPRIITYPKKKSLLQQVLGMGNKEDDMETALQARLGTPYYNIFKEAVWLKENCNIPQTRIPFQFVIN